MTAGTSISATSASVRCRAGTQVWRLRSQQESPIAFDSDHERTPKMQTATAYLETLNPEQRRAVDHGATGGLAAPPLLVIAGAGSGKTNTLAHRVAHLIVRGADPRRIVFTSYQTGRTHRPQGNGRQRRGHDERTDLGRLLRWNMQVLSDGSRGSPAASNSSLILSSFPSYFDPEFNRSNSPCSGTR